MTALEQHDATPCTASGCTRPQAPGILLCAPDAARLGDWLAQIQTEYEQLSAVPSMAGREYGTIGGTTLAGQRNPARLDVLVLRDHRSRERDNEDPDGNNGRGVLEILHARAEEVREGRDLSEPVTYTAACRFPCMHRSCLLGHPRPVRQPLTVARERRLLSDHLDWVMAQDWCGEFFDEIRALWSLLRSANGGNSSKRKPPVGRCAQQIGDHECGGPLWADDNATEVLCGTCGHLYEQDELRRLGDQMLREGYVLIERASWYTGVPAGTIRRWVSEQRITSEKQGRRLCVNVAEIEDLRDTLRTKTAVS